MELTRTPYSARCGPGDVVVDLGCGPGIFALLACRAGAKRVYAIDAGEVIHFARQLAVANGFADRIEFLHGDSKQMQLAERANVLVSDVRGALPLFADALPSIEDARERFLIKGGAQIPQRDTVYAAIVETPDYYNRLVSPWKDAGRGMDLTPALPLVLNSVYKIRSQRDAASYGAASLVHIGLYGEAETARRRESCNSPRRAAERRMESPHGSRRSYLKKSDSRLPLETWELSTARDFFRGSSPWRSKRARKLKWICTPIRLAAITFGAGIRRSPRITASPNEASDSRPFKGAQFTSERLRKRATDYVPVLSESGEAERWLLEAMDGSTPLQEIAQSAVERFPKVFRGQDDAFRRVSALAEKFSR